MPASSRRLGRCRTGGRPTSCSCGFISLEDVREVPAAWPRPGVVRRSDRPAVRRARHFRHRSRRAHRDRIPAGCAARAGGPAAAPPARGAPGRGRTGGAQAAGPNYPLYLALGADFVVDVRAAGDTTVVDLHDVAAGALRRAFPARLPAPAAAGFRMAVHRLADQVLQATLGAPGMAATRVGFVKDGKVYVIDQDGADMRLVSSTDRQAMSPAWAPDARRLAVT